MAGVIRTTNKEITSDIEFTPVIRSLLQQIILVQIVISEALVTGNSSDELS
jgi:hypothetical protein